jgi:LPXTG-motif cell wall-anchored protein
VSRWLPRFALPAAVAVGALFTLTPAAFAASAYPPGNNGTVKIQTTDVDSVDNSDSANDPHVPCSFSVVFDGFDLNQTVKIVVNIQPPSGDNNDELLNETKTFDTAHTYDYTGADLKDLTTFTFQPQQGYHLKLTIFIDGSEYKHKVFWLQCDAPTTPPTTETSGGGGGSSSTDPGDPGTSTSPGGGGSLPLTGPAIGGIVAAGIGLVAAGTVLVVARRRRDATDAS